MDLSDNIEDTPIIEYTPDTVDEYIVVVNLPEDWEEVHNYIINENEIDIINDIIKGFKTENYMIESDRKKAIINACKNIDNKTILLVAGKGHEDYQIIGNNYIPHNDMEILRKELK